MLEQDNAVSPMAQLLPRDRDASDGGCHGHCHEHRLAASPVSQQFSRAPDEANENSDQRNITVTVRHRLGPYLNDTNHRHECAEIPKPPHRKPRLTPQAENAKRGYHGQEQDRGCNPPQRRLI